MKSKSIISLMLVLSMSLFFIINAGALDGNSTHIQMDTELTGDFTNYFSTIGGVTRDNTEADSFYDPVSKQNSIRSENLPTSVDLSTEIFFPKIGNQGEINSCSGWATTYYQFGYQVARMNNWNAKYDSSLQFSPKWTYNFLNSGNNIGVDINNTYKILKNHGAVRYSEFTPALITNNTQNIDLENRQWCLNTNAMRNALNYRLNTKTVLSLQAINNYTNTPITSNNSPRLNEIKSRLYNKQVLTFISETSLPGWEIKALSNQYTNSLNGQSICISDSSLSFGLNPSYHISAIVGYDDNIWYDLNGNGTQEAYEKGAFKIAGSYGTNIWNNGYIWILYDAINKVSNVSEMNSILRVPIIDQYKYYAITVKEFPVDLSVEVTVKQRYRNQVAITCGVAPINGSVPLDTDEYYTFLHFSGGSYNFSGTSQTNQEASFVFDFDNLSDDYSQTSNYVIKALDDTPNNPTILKSIRIIDNTGYVVHTDNEQKSIDATSQSNGKVYCSYAIGLLGDVDFDDLVTILDVNRIQCYLVGLFQFTDPIEYKLADVDGDGMVTSMDTLRIQRYLAGLCNISDSIYSYLG